MVALETTIFSSKNNSRTNSFLNLQSHDIVSSAQCHIKATIHSKFLCKNEMCSLKLYCPSHFNIYFYVQDNLKLSLTLDIKATHFIRTDS